MFFSLPNKKQPVLSISEWMSEPRFHDKLPLIFELKMEFISPGI